MQSTIGRRTRDPRQELRTRQHHMQNNQSRRRKRLESRTGDREHKHWSETLRERIFNILYPIVTVIAYLENSRGLKLLEFSTLQLMTTSGLQGQHLDITVVGCLQLGDTEWISRKDPHDCLEYANNRFQTKTWIDDGKNPSFKEKFVLILIENLHKINISIE